MKKKAFSFCVIVEQNIHHRFMETFPEWMGSVVGKKAASFISASVDVTAFWIMHFYERQMVNILQMYEYTK